MQQGTGFALLRISSVAMPLLGVRMLVSSLIVAWLLIAPSATTSLDTIQQSAPIGTEATSAPADSSASWYRRTAIDMRLVQPTSTASTTDTLPHRRHAVEYSDWYYRRLQTHKWGSYLELPIFAGEYWLGNKLLSHSEATASWVKPTHATVAGALGGLFAINTLTGVWNLYDSRNDTDQRALVWSHSALMLAADAGFALTGLLADDAGHTTSGGNRHRNVALASMGFATAGTLLMWVKRGL
jgi:hypothetical protein